MSETKQCEICGRQPFPPVKEGYDPNLCFRLTLPMDRECFRLGYEREQARADAAEAERRKTALFYNCGAEPPCEKCITCQWDDALEALAAARRECEGLRTALTTIRDALNRPWLMGSEVNRVAVDCANAVLEADAALAAPAAGEENFNG